MFAELREKQAQLKRETPDLPRIYRQFEDKAEAPPTHLLLSGRASSPGPVMQPRVPAVLVSTQPVFPPPAPKSTLRRLTLAQWIAFILGIVGLLILGLLLFIPTLVIAPFFLIALRRAETTDPVVRKRVNAAYTRAIAIGEDRDVSNPFSAIGSFKPGWFRLAIATIALRLVGLSGIFVYHSGRLARV